MEAGREGGSVFRTQGINKWLFGMTTLLQSASGEQLTAVKLLTKSESASDGRKKMVD